MTRSGSRDLVRCQFSHGTEPDDDDGPQEAMAGLNWVDEDAERHVYLRLFSRNEHTIPMMNYTDDDNDAAHMLC